MGLLMVVILIIIGAVFYLKYAVLSDKDESFQSTEREIQAVNSVKALMNLETCNVTIKKAIDMCSNQEDLCGELSCDNLEQKSSFILTQKREKCGGVCKYARKTCFT